MKRLTFLLIMAAALMVSCANTNPDVPPTPVDDGYDAEPVRQDLFNTSNGDGVVPPYRIPGIAVAHNGDLIATAARLVCGTDPGYGRNDIVCRISSDNGATWSDIREVAVGTGVTSATENYFDTAFGDPAIVADRTSDEVLIMAVAGCTVYGNGRTTRQNPNLIATIRSSDNGKTWGAPENVTEDIYSLFDGDVALQAAFVSGGNIFQSRTVKVGDYYRLYVALCARPNGNRVIYSDDFGRTWQVLGGASAHPILDGDEAKCEEMPNGDVVVSSRIKGGRLYNIFNYIDKTVAHGSWDKSIITKFDGSGHSMGNNATNGDILVVPVKRVSDGEQVELLLQSVPTADKRAQVGIYYKELSFGTSEYCAADFEWWNGFFLVSNTDSAYSSLCLQSNKRIAIIYEETLTGFGKRPNPVSTCFPNGEGEHNFDGFDNIYVSYNIEQITDGAYTIVK
jgi:sialidase-1